MIEEGNSKIWRINNNRKYKLYKIFTALALTLIGAYLVYFFVVDSSGQTFSYIHLIWLLIVGQLYFTPMLNIDISNDGNNWRIRKTHFSDPKKRMNINVSQELFRGYEYVNETLTKNSRILFRYETESGAQHETAIPLHHFTVTQRRELFTKLKSAST